MPRRIGKHLRKILMSPHSASCKVHIQVCNRVLKTVKKENDQSDIVVAPGITAWMHN